MSFWANFQRKIIKPNTSDDGLKVALLASVLSSDPDSLQHRPMPSLLQKPIDPSQTLYSGETLDS